MTSNSIYEVFAAGQKVGIVIARNATAALEAAHYATTRRTESKIDVACDYDGLYVRKLTGRVAPMGEWLSDPKPVDNTNT